MEKTIDQRVEEVTYNRAKVWQLVLFALNNTSTNIYLFAFMFITIFQQVFLG